MKQPSNKNRIGGRYPHFNNNRRNNLSIPTKNTVFDSSGPCGRMRGTALQLCEKYQTAAKDARHNDTILSEICLQYADHYQRIYTLACQNEKPAFCSPETNLSCEQNDSELSSQNKETSLDNLKNQNNNTNDSEQSNNDALPSNLPFMNAPLPEISQEEPKKTKKIRKTKKIISKQDDEIEQQLPV